MRAVGERNILDKFCAIAEKYCRYIIVSGFVAISSGRARATEEIDMNIAFKEELLRSEKDLKDAEHLRKIYAEQINEPGIRRIKRMIKKLRLL